jgi:hypothetical protein
LLIVPKKAAQVGFNRGIWATARQGLTLMPRSNAKLEKMLTAYKKGIPVSAKTKPVSIIKKVEVLQNAESFFQEKTGIYSVSYRSAMRHEKKLADPA